MKIFFWTSALLVAYTYFGYPLVLWALTERRPRNVRRKAIFPRVSIIIAARNEAMPWEGEMERKPRWSAAAAIGLSRFMPTPPHMLQPRQHTELASVPAQ